MYKLIIYVKVNKLDLKKNPLSKYFLMSHFEEFKTVNLKYVFKWVFFVIIYQANIPILSILLFFLFFGYIIKYPFKVSLYSF